jgi:hypothetical protein
MPLTDLWLIAPTVPTRAFRQAQPGLASIPFSTKGAASGLSRRLLRAGAAAAKQGSADREGAEGRMAPETVIAADLASWTVMSTSQSRRFPVTVTHLPVTRCQICQQTVAYRPGSLSEVLTEHYRRAHPQALGMPS